MVWFYRNCQWALQYHFKVLSIPLWSDFIVIANGLSNTTLKSFQSHYGLILSYGYIVRNASTLNTFQSHYGLILSN